jgi:hypothetical protein
MYTSNPELKSKFLCCTVILKSLIVSERRSGNGDAVQKYHLNGGLSSSESFQKDGNPDDALNSQSDMLCAASETALTGHLAWELFV